jgi:hypothetical protein
MRTLRDAGQPAVHWALEDGELQHQSRASDTTQGSNRLSYCAPLQLQSLWGSARESRGIQIPWSPASAGGR